MKAAVIHQPGGPEQLQLEEIAVPQPREGQVLVKVKAFGLNRSELMTRKGLSPGVRFPRILGIECVGEVADDPGGQWSPGQKVAAFMGGMGRDFDGSYAEFAVLPKSVLEPFSSNLTWDILGALPEMFQTTYGSLHKALQIKSGDVILVRGGTSSIGLLAIQMAKAAGLTVVATTRNAEKEQFLKDKGADYVLIDDNVLHKSVRHIFADGVNKVLELVGTNTLADSLQCAAPGGVVCMTGMLSETWSFKDFAPMDYIPSTVSLTTYNTGQIRIGAAEFQAFISDVESRKIQISIGRKFPLDQIVTAHQLMDSNSASGKIVIVND